MTAPRIYVASLADYNAGRHHGTHIEITGQDAEEIHDAIKAMLAMSREPVAEDWAIHDHEGFGKWNLSEWANIEHIALVGQALVNDTDGNLQEPFMYWWSRVLMEGRTRITDMYDDNPDGLWEAFTEEYQGDWTSWKEFVMESELADSYLALNLFRRMAQDYDESNKWQHVDHASKAETLFDRLVAFLDWDMVARDAEHEMDGYDVEKAPELGGGYWIFRDES